MKKQNPEAMHNPRCEREACKNYEYCGNHAVACDVDSTEPICAACSKEVERRDFWMYHWRPAKLVYIGLPG